MNAENNWWGKANGPGPVGPGSGDRVSTNVDYDPWLGKPANNNVLYLVPKDESVYIQPGQQIIVDMNVANLQQMVSACQAMLGYSSYFFGDPTGGAVQPGSVAPGGGPWDQLIYDSWAVGAGIPGEIDTAIGVYGNSSAGTQADNTVAIITLTSNAVEGVTQMIFRPDLVPDPGLTKSTFLSDMTGNAVWPAKVNSTNIYIDGTVPTVTTFSADPLCTKTTTTLTFMVADENSGVDYVDVYVGTTMVAHDLASPYALDMSGYGTGSYAVKIRVVDNAGNEADSLAATVDVDQTAPTIGSITATQGGSSVLCPNLAVQGVMDIDVTATDAGCSGMTRPVVVVDGITPTTDNGQTGDTYHYQVTVLSTTANGTHTITVTAKDALLNETVDSSKAICVDKNQAAGTVTFATLSSTGYSVARDVVFVATNGSNAVVKTWTVSVLFTNASGTASGPYTLTNVPATTAHLSAKTAWHLRQRQDKALDGDGQATADFMLLGGDINGSNSVNILDYAVLKGKWNTAGPAADINGDGQVQFLDYNLMKGNWFKVGDAQ